MRFFQSDWWDRLCSQVGRGPGTVLFKPEASLAAAPFPARVCAQTGSRGTLEGGPLQASGILPWRSLPLGIVSTPAPSVSPDSQSCFSAQGALPGCPLPAPHPENSLPVECGAGVGFTSLAFCLPSHSLPFPGVWCFANHQFVHGVCFDCWRWEGKSSFCYPILYGSGSQLFFKFSVCVGSQVPVPGETHSSLAK